MTRSRSSAPWRVSAGFVFVGMTCCFGFPTRRKHAVGMSLAGRADIVMRRAKENGKNRTGAAG